LGLALDEPKDKDEKHEAAGFSFVVDPDESPLVFGEGQVHVDYRDSPWGGGFIVRTTAASSCC